MKSKQKLEGRFQSCVFVFNCSSLATGKAANGNRGAYIQVHGLNKFKTSSYTLTQKPVDCGSNFLCIQQMVAPKSTSEAYHFVQDH